jgi:hypothetical protein
MMKKINEMTKREKEFMIEFCLLVVRIRSLLHPYASGEPLVVIEPTIATIQLTTERRILGDSGKNKREMG